MAASKFSLSVLRIRDFRLLLLVRFLLVMTLQAQSVIVGWQVYSLTKDPFMLGLTGLAEALPALTCALFAGHIVDTGHPRKIYAATIIALMLNTLGLFLVGSGTLAVSQHFLLSYIFFGIFFSGVARSLTMPSAFALTAAIVPRAEMSAALAWLSACMQISIVTGPAVAGLIYGGYGARGAWMFPALLISLAAAAAVFLRTHPPRREEKREAAWHSIRAGWQFIWRTPTLLSVMALDMFAVLFGGAVAMLPAFADQILHVGSEGLGALRAAPALGGVLTALFLALRPMKKISALRLLWVVAGFGACMIGFGLSTSFWLSLAFLMLSGIFDSINMLIRSTLTQLLTPENMRGRVSAINSMFIISSNEIGSFESGTAARVFGLVPSVVLGGIASMAVVSFIAAVSPKLRKTVVDANTA